MAAAFASNFAALAKNGRTEIVPVQLAMNLNT